jgi:hypothetical protein
MCFNRCGFLIQLSSPPAKLDAFFAEGFDDANRFLKEITP